MNVTMSSLGMGAVAALALAVASPASAPAAGIGQPPDFSAFRIITDRNIFDPNRRPRAAAAPAPKIVDSFSLAGTMSYAKGEFAFFDGNSAEYHRVVGPGGSIAGYTVEDIGQDGVRLVSGTNQVQLKVGMQMRRNQDGRWSPAEPAESAGTSYASTSSRRSSSRRQSPGGSRPTAIAASSQPAPTAEPGPEMPPDGSCKTLTFTRTVTPWRA